MQNSRQPENLHGRLLRIPRRRGVWLFDYKDVKYNTRLQWRLQLCVGLCALIFGSVALVFLIRRALNGSVELVSLALAICAVLWGLLYAPAAVIYFIRRHRGEPVDPFDYEILDQGKTEHEGQGVDPQKKNR